jgi:prophage regulatory protein
MQRRDNYSNSTSARALGHLVQQPLAEKPTAPEVTDRFIRQHELESLTALNRVTLWRLERAGRFPRRRKISGKCVGWLLSEVTAWMRSREAA